MARAAGVDRDMLVVGNTLFDIKKFLACSALMVSKDRSATGSTLLARNLDHPSLGYIHEYTMVTIYRPRHGLAFATVGFPGIVGVLSGLNQAGLAVAVLEVFDVREGETHFDPRGVPYALCLRQVLEQARTIAEAIRLLEKMHRTTTINLAIADPAGTAVLEISPRRVVRRSGRNGVCIATNHFCSPDLRPDKPVNVTWSFQRFGLLGEMEKSRETVTPEGLRKQLDRVNLGALTLQTMVFEPGRLRLHLSVGRIPASRFPLRTIDLGKLLIPEKPDRR
jgi:hypothetical protein